MSGSARPSAGPERGGPWRRRSFRSRTLSLSLALLSVAVLRAFPDDTRADGARLAVVSGPDRSVHWTASGHRVVADAVEGFLRGSGWIGRES